MIVPVAVVLPSVRLLLVKLAVNVSAPSASVSVAAFVVSVKLPAALAVAEAVVGAKSAVTALPSTKVADTLRAPAGFEMTPLNDSGEPSLAKALLTTA